MVGLLFGQVIGRLPQLPDHLGIPVVDYLTGTCYISSVSDGILNIGGRTTTTQEIGIHSDAATAHQQAQALPDLEAVLQRQQIVSKATADIGSGVQTFRSRMVADAAKERQEHRKRYEADLQAQNDDSYEAYLQLCQPQRSPAGRRQCRCRREERPMDGRAI